MKKELKKLALNRETVRTLAEHSLAEVAGAMPKNTRSCLGGCPGPGTGGGGGSLSAGFDCPTQSTSAFASGCNC